LLSAYNQFSIHKDVREKAKLKGESWVSHVAHTEAVEAKEHSIPVDDQGNDIGREHAEKDTTPGAQLDDAMQLDEPGETTPETSADQMTDNKPAASKPEYDSPFDPATYPSPWPFIPCANDTPPLTETLSFFSPKDRRLADLRNQKERKVAGTTDAKLGVADEDPPVGTTSHAANPGSTEADVKMDDAEEQDLKPTANVQQEEAPDVDMTADNDWDSKEASAQVCTPGENKDDLERFWAFANRRVYYVNGLLYATVKLQH
jgi:hypothetical protein